MAYCSGRGRSLRMRSSSQWDKYIHVRCILYSFLLSWSDLVELAAMSQKQLLKLSEESLTKEPEEVFDLEEKIGEG